MSRFSQAEAEALGWSIVHKRDEYEVTVGPGLTQKHPATIVAEKYVSRPGEAGRFIHEEAETVGLLLERIHAWEQHQKSITPESVPAPVDTSSELPQFSPLYELAEDEGKPTESVVIPADPGNLNIDAPTVTITDAEWSARSRADTLVTSEGQVVHAGGTESVLDAEDARLINKKAIEDRRAAEPVHGPTEQVDFDTAGLVDTPGIGAGGTVVVREGESLDEVAGRKEDLKKMREEGRVASANLQGEAYAPEGADKLAGLDVGIQERGDLGSELPPAGNITPALEEPEDESEENPAPHLYPEGVPAVSEPPEEPSHEGEQEARSEAEEAEAKEQRDESLADAESDEANAEVREAGIEAAEEAHEGLEDEPDPNAEEVAADEAGELDVQKPDSFTENDDIEATDAAKAKAEELGVDLSEVEGTGKDGRIIAPDVEAAAEEATQPDTE